MNKVDFQRLQDNVNAVTGQRRQKQVDGLAEVLGAMWHQLQKVNLKERRISIEMSEVGGGAVVAGVVSGIDRQGDWRAVRGEVQILRSMGAMTTEELLNSAVNNGLAMHERKG